MKITKLKKPWMSIELCCAIRQGRFKVTKEVRDTAKQVSFAFAYGTTGSIIPTNREINRHIATYDNTNLFIVRGKLS